MNAPAYSSVLRQDALYQLGLNPTASHRWHRLTELLLAEPTPEACAEVVAAVRTRIATDGVEGFYRATFLAALEHDPAELARAGQLLHTISPFDADRVMAFTAYQWGLAVSHGAGHASLRGRLLTAQAPALMVRAGAQLAANAAGLLAPRVPATLRKVALVAPFIGNAKHPPTDMALQQAELLLSLGLEVTLFSCQEMLQPHMAQYLGCRGDLAFSPPVMNELAARLPRGMQANLSDPVISMMRRWRDMLVKIAQFDPDLVMFVGLSSPLLHPLYAARPVLGLGIHAVSPMAPVDAWLTADAARAGRAGSEWGDALPPAFGHYHPFRVKLAPEAAPVTRDQLAIGSGQLAMVTVGSRLPHEIRGPWATRMLAVLAHHPHLVWVLVGGDGVLPPALAGADPAQLRLFPHRTDLRSVLRCCDIYLNPPRMGGGFSVAEAMAEGLPVLALADGDGGSKLAGMALASDEAWFNQLDTLIVSPALRAQTGQAMQAHFRLNLDLSRSGPSLMQGCELALQRYRMRAA
jgi:hypothetical protein